MTVKLDLPPEIEAELAAQAKTRGLSLEAHLMQIARQQSHLATSPELTREQWVHEFDAHLASFPDTPVLPDEAMKRENWYSGRG
ncbi:MAG TPA: hypothetical protein VN633_24410 [Bryobacteraceae bacterium]|nr:hypothetical protein [Bryobacteraceae bacterium]